MQFGSPKQHLGGRWFHNNEEIYMDIRDELQMKVPHVYQDKFLKLSVKMRLCISKIVNWDLRSVGL
jgi:hypothetical protein